MRRSLVALDGSNGIFPFMFLAPDTILDNLQDAAIAGRFEALEQKVQDLQRDLDNIDS